MDGAGEVHNEGLDTTRFDEHPTEIQPETGVMAGFEAKMAAPRGHQTQEVLAHLRGSYYQTNMIRAVPATIAYMTPFNKSSGDRGTWSVRR